MGAVGQRRAHRETLAMGSSAPNMGAVKTNPEAQTGKHPTLEAIWNHANEWAGTSKELRKRQTRYQVFGLWLGSLGAVLGTAASQKEIWISKETMASAPQVLGYMSAVFVAVSAFFARELLTPERQLAWARCRLVAEAIRREVWLSLHRLPPYAESDALAKLQQRVDAMTGFARTATLEGYVSNRAFPRGGDIASYIEVRARDQIQYYSKHALEMQSKLAFWRWTVFVLGIATVAIGTMASWLGASASAWVAVLTTASAAVVSFLQAHRLEELPPIFQETRRRLERLVALHRDGALGDLELVRQCEEAMAKENQSWRATWFSEETRPRGAGAEEPQKK